MTRLSLALIFVAYTIISVGIVFAQHGGTVRGQIVDTTERQNPIEGVEVVIVAQDSTEFKQRQMRMVIMKNQASPQGGI